MVTDSSARLPAEVARAHGIEVVPLHILVDGADLRDGVDDIPPDIHDRHATTAGATPTELCAAYQRALAAAAATAWWASTFRRHCRAPTALPRQAARQLGAGVTVVDSKSAAMGTGFVALAAARAAAAGADLQTVAAEASSAVGRTHAYIVVHRLDNLRRSGRIGGAAAWLGTALSLKPLLRIDNGKLVLAQRVRTATKAVAAMLDQVCAVVGDEAAAVAVHHVADPDAAAEVAGALAERLPACEPAIITDLGPVLALHVGAGAVGVVVQLPDTPTG